MIVSKYYMSNETCKIVLLLLLQQYHLAIKKCGIVDVMTGIAKSVYNFSSSHRRSVTSFERLFKHAAFNAGIFFRVVESPPSFSGTAVGFPVFGLIFGLSPSMKNLCSAFLSTFFKVVSPLFFTFRIDARGRSDSPCVGYREDFHVSPSNFPYALSAVSERFFHGEKFS